MIPIPNKTYKKPAAPAKHSPKHAPSQPTVVYYTEPAPPPKKKPASPLLVHIPKKKPVAPKKKSPPPVAHPEPMKKPSSPLLVHIPKKKPAAPKKKSPPPPPSVAHPEPKKKEPEGPQYEYVSVPDIPIPSPSSKARGPFPKTLGKMCLSPYMNSPIDLVPWKYKSKFFKHFRS